MQQSATLTHPVTGRVFPGVPGRTRARTAVAVPAPAARGRQPLADESVNDLLQTYSRTRDPRVRDRLVMMHERMVRYLASRFGLGAGTTLDDLVQVGYIGLLAAIDRFDPGRGASFATFAVPTILGELKRYFRDQTWGLKAPRRLRELGLSLRRIKEELEQTLGRPPSITEMASAARVPEERLLQAMELDRVYQPASLDVQGGEDGGDERTAGWDSIGEDDPHIARIEERESLQHALAMLDGRQRSIVELRFFGEMSQADVARRLGISQMHVSRLERQALKRLRIMLAG